MDESEETDRDEVETKYLSLLSKIKAKIRQMSQSLIEFPKHVSTHLESAAVMPLSNARLPSVNIPTFSELSNECALTDSGFRSARRVVVKGRLTDLQKLSNECALTDSGFRSARRVVVKGRLTDLQKFGQPAIGDEELWQLN
ncbi:hypothetical protein HUJ05_001508 [Dendroctonus ponderosae]|nr:hypothetical protein HUJ05_001508 [Dendroctonus ponderosae]